ncbi:MAG: vanadium-dependent haloperoxidase, partial [Bacteroidota bacterium]|nr:vanadium-dependent haloperoxidase [Bacteroidota bacterium]
SDAFISCWNEKYRSNRIRPETFINAHIDPNWRSLLQTPPFPEYTSGHSVVSAAVAWVLTALAGENFAYTDTVEVEFGLPARKFTSFQQAAQEAAISRLYGGIHYRDAVENGLKQGQQIGQFVLQKLKPEK